MRIVYEPEEISKLIIKHTKETLGLDIIILDDDFFPAIEAEVVEKDNIILDKETHYEESQALEPVEENTEIEELKEEADKLGIKYRSNITFDTLKERVEEFKAKKEEEEEETSPPDEDEEDEDEEQEAPRKSIFAR